jgi:aminomethyltransferase
LDNLLKTPLHQKHQKLNAKSVSFCGWDMPMSYDSIIKEYEYCRNSSAIFDTSHMGELFFDGDIKNSGINEATSVDIQNIPIGKCKYGFLLNEDGGVVDDLIIYRLSEKSLMIVVNASRVELDFTTIQNRLNSGVLKNSSSEFGKIDIQGPKSLEVLQPFVDIDLKDMKFFSFINSKINGKDVLISRTGYTGELGFELYSDDKTTNYIWDKLTQNGAYPAGLGARDLLRLEMGYSLYGNDLSQEINPLMANLSKFINIDRDFIGAKALRENKKDGIKKLLIPFKTTSRRSARAGFIVFQNNKEIGVVTSGAYSPALSVGIGLALIDIELLNRDENFIIQNDRSQIEASFASLPFI